MRQKMAVYTGRLEIIEYPGVVVREPVLLKPIYVYIGELERSIIEGLLPVKPPVVLGSFGVARVIEVSGSNTEYTGRVFTVKPFGDHGILGVEVDGLLANYTSIHPSYLDDVLLDPKPIDSIKPLIKHSTSIAMESLEPVLIEGCGLTGLLTGLALRYSGVEPAYYCEQSSKLVLQYGFTIYKHIGDVVEKWGSIVLTSINQASKYKLTTRLDYKKLIISPLSFTQCIPLRKRESLFSINIASGVSSEESSVVKKVSSDLARIVRVVEVEDLKSILGLLPPRSPGFILSLK